MVRRPGHDEVVGRHLAERRVRHVGGQQAAGRLETGVADGPQCHRGNPDRPRPRRAAIHPRHPHPRLHARRNQRGLRSHRLRENLGRAQHDRGVRRRRAVPPGRLVVSQEILVRQRGRRGLLDRDDAGHGQAGRSDHEDLRRSDRRPGAVGAHQLQCRRDRRHGDAAAVLRDAGRDGAGLVVFAGVDAAGLLRATGSGPPLRADERHHARVPCPRLRRPVHQRREPRLLLLGVRPGGGARARADRPLPQVLGTRHARRRRMAHDSRRTARHRHLSRPRRGRCRRRHALGDRRRGRASRRGGNRGRRWKSARRLQGLDSCPLRACAGVAGPAGPGNG